MKFCFLILVAIRTKPDVPDLTSLDPISKHNVKGEPIATFWDVTPCGLMYRHCCENRRSALLRASLLEPMFFIPGLVKAGVGILFVSLKTVSPLHRFYSVDHNGRAVEAMKCLRVLKHWDRGFESHSRYVFLCLCCSV
jgi:hypothetical protein